MFMTKEKIVYRVRKICTFCQKQIGENNKLLEMEAFVKKTFQGDIYFEMGVKTETNRIGKIIVANASNANRDVKTAYRQLYSLFDGLGLKEIYCVVDNEQSEKLTLSDKTLIAFNVHVEQW